MRILFACGREPRYPRNDVLLRALRRLGTVETVTDSRPGSLVLRSLRVLTRLLPRLVVGRHDLVLVGFYGYLLMPLVGVLSRRPVLFDAFVSNYDTLCFDRARFSPRSLPGRLAFWLDQVTCQQASRVLLDTAGHAEYFARTFNLSRAKLCVLPVGCNEELFYPRPVPASSTGTTRVLYYSSFMPLHGVETIIRAAALLCFEPRLQFRLIGQGQTYASVRRLADDLRLDNVTFVPPVPLDALPAEIAAADICLGGHFGSSAKASRVIPGKIYQELAIARPVIASDTLSNAELLTHGQSAWLCPPDDPQALAEAVLALHRDSALRDALASGGHALYLRQCSEAVITTRLSDLVRQIL
jgi:glycosyltransferase involved in cell wall biosynthesis